MSTPLISQDLWLSNECEVGGEFDVHGTALNTYGKVNN